MILHSQLSLLLPSPTWVQLLCEYTVIHTHTHTHTHTHSLIPPHTYTLTDIHTCTHRHTRTISYGPYRFSSISACLEFYRTSKFLPKFQAKNTGLEVTLRFLLISLSTWVVTAKKYAWIACKIHVSLSSNTVGHTGLEFHCCSHHTSLTHTALL